MQTDFRVMGVDFGDSRTGVALSDPLWTLASPLQCVKGGMKGTAEQIATLILEHNVGIVVVGLPKNMDGTEGFRAERVKAFCEMLQTLTTAKIETYDERLSTVEAYRMMDLTGTFGKKRKENIDILSAKIILQDWLDREKHKKEEK